MADLFNDLPEQQAPERSAGAPRLASPEREQAELVPLALDDLVDGDHQVRRVWRFVEGLDLTPLLMAIKAREGRAGRPPIDPRILIALWLYATLDGIGSARAVARLCKESAPYRWVCGGVGVNHHSLADFRVAHVGFLDDLLTRSVATLVTAGLVCLEELAQDGIKVRASAGASSFRRRPSLGKALKQARKRVEALKREIKDDPDAGNRRRRAARERAAAEAEARVTQALAEMERLEAERAASPNKGKPAPRVSTTDPQARVMKMADGGFRPAWNAQIVTDPASQVVVAVDLAPHGSDRGLLQPTLRWLRERFDQAPARFLADGGYTSLKDIEWAAGPDGGGTEIYCPLPNSKHATPPETPRRGDGPGVRDWRQRMASDAGKEIYKRRSPAECPHAHFRRRGLNQLLVRGREKVRAVLLWHALAHNLTRLQAA